MIILLLFNKNVWEDLTMWREKVVVQTCLPTDSEADCDQGFYTQRDKKRH